MNRNSSEQSYEAVDDDVVLGVLDDLLDLLNGTIDVCTDSPHKNDIFPTRISCFSSDLD